MNDSQNIFVAALPTMVALASYVTPALDDGESVMDGVLSLIQDKEDLLPLIIGQSVWIHVLIERLVTLGDYESVDEYLQILGLSAHKALGGN